MTTDASPTTAAERPLRRDAARNRERILAAAGEVFATRGLEVTLDDIAHHAGVGVGTVYRRFRDKEQLIDALFDERMDAVVAAAENALARGRPVARPRGLLQRASSSSSRPTAACASSRSPAGTAASASRVRAPSWSR